MSSILALAWQRYLRQLQERPLITKVCKWLVVSLQCTRLLRPGAHIRLHRLALRLHSPAPGVQGTMELAQNIGDGGASLVPLPHNKSPPHTHRCLGSSTLAPPTISGTRSSPTSFATTRRPAPSCARCDRKRTTGIRRIFLCTQVALDQLVFGPCSNVIMMAYIAMVVEGRSWPFTQRKIKRDYPALQINGWKVWQAERHLSTPPFTHTAVAPCIAHQLQICTAAIPSAFCQHCLCVLVR